MYLHTLKIFQIIREIADREKVGWQILKYKDAIGQPIWECEKDNKMWQMSSRELDLYGTDKDLPDNDPRRTIIKSFIDCKKSATETQQELEKLANLKGFW